jgi:hypothetical protein
MIGSVPDKILDNNGLYMHLKVLNAEQASEIKNLKERLAIMEKDLGDTKIQCETYRCVTADSALYLTNSLLYVATLLIDSQVNITIAHAAQAQDVRWS